ncbi:MAG: flavin reductase family protein [Candidatus Brockarchaeota archaeon]|nr:flavin reductase family protein [Candidatus Brockarchaeota archaeon]
MKKIVEEYRAVFPTPAALITSADEEGRANVATAGETFMMSLRPLVVAVGFRPATYTNSLIRKTREFVVNLPTVKILKAVDFCGTHSGRDVDKFKATGLTPLPSKHVKPPLIKECPVNIECRVRGIVTFGSHDVFAGDSLAIHVDEEILGNDGMPDISKAPTIAFANGRYYSVDTLLEPLRFSRSEKGEGGR